MYVLRLAVFRVRRVVVRRLAPTIRKARENYQAAHPAPHQIPALTTTVAIKNIATACDFCAARVDALVHENTMSDQSRPRIFFYSTIFAKIPILEMANKISRTPCSEVRGAATLQSCVLKAPWARRKKGFRMPGLPRSSFCRAACISSSVMLGAIEIHPNTLERFHCASAENARERSRSRDAGPALILVNKKILTEIGFECVKHRASLV